MRKLNKIFALLLVLMLAVAITSCQDGACTACVDADKNAICDECGEAIACTSCIDMDKNAKCDVCGKDVAHTVCFDDNKDAKCDICDDAVACASCVDVDKNAKCDVCGKMLACTSCVDIDKNAKCDVCNKDVPLVGLGTETVESISITTKPTKTSYYTNEKFDPAGMVVKATLKGGEVVEVSEYQYDEYSSLTSSVKAIHVYYGGRVASVDIIVSDIELNGVYDAKRAYADSYMLVRGYYVSSVSGGFVVKDTECDVFVEVRGNAADCKSGDEIRFFATLVKSGGTYLEYSSDDELSVVSSDNSLAGEYSSATGIGGWRRMQNTLKGSKLSSDTMYKIYGELYILKDTDGYIIHMNESAKNITEVKPDGIRVVKIAAGTVGAEYIEERFGAASSTFPGKKFTGEIFAIPSGFGDDYYEFSVVDESWITLESVVTPEHSALVEVAYAFYYKGNYIHYDQYGTRRNINPSPEDATADSRLHLDCSSFVNAVYYEAFGENIAPFEHTVISPQTGKLTGYAKDYLGVNPDVVGYWVLSELDTDEKKAEFLNMIENTLEIGDVIINRRTSETGHAIIYVGNGYFLHSTGSSYEYDTSDPHNAYDQANAQEIRSGTISKLALSSVLDADNGRYLLASNNVTLVLLRPLARGLTITDETTSRMTIPGITMEKSSNVGPYTSVHTGESIIYSVKLENKSKNDVSGVVLHEFVPEGCEFIGGTPGLVNENGALSWTGDIDAGETVYITYVVTVVADEAGFAIESTEGNVNGVGLNKLINTVSGYSKQTLAGLVEAAEAIVASEIEFADPILMVKALYQSIGCDDILDDETALSILADLISIENKSVNKESDLYELLVENLYGGYSIRSGYFTDNGRIRLVTLKNLSVGDVIIAEYGDETTDSATVEAYVYLGEGRMIGITSADGIAKYHEVSTNEYKNLLVSLISFDRYVILRPSQK